jgi:hypothetical protein
VYRLPTTTYYHHQLTAPGTNSRRSDHLIKLKISAKLAEARAQLCLGRYDEVGCKQYEVIRSYEVSRTSSVASRKYCVSITATPLYLLLSAHYYHY